jgi:hypothetical protein
MNIPWKEREKIIKTVEEALKHPRYVDPWH